MKQHSVLIATAFTLLATSMAASAGRPRQAKPPAAQADPAITKSVGDMTAAEEQQFSDAAESAIERACLACHPFQMIAQTRRMPPDWNTQVDTMVARGAPGTEADVALIKKYLIRYYGVVRVNAATPEELTAVLGVPEKIAVAIVDYRKAHGNFSDLASLEQVPGVDKAKLEEQPEALRFD